MELRQKVRAELNLDGKFVIGNVARFTYQKNHEFLIKIFNDIYKRDNNAMLLLIGDGELEQEIQKQIHELRLEESVLFLGPRK